VKKGKTKSNQLVIGAFLRPVLKRIQILDAGVAIKGPLNPTATGDECAQ
jgi:hypothetical protein